MGRGHSCPRNIPVAHGPGGRESDRRTDEPDGHLSDTVLRRWRDFAPGEVWKQRLLLTSAGIFDRHLDVLENVHVEYIT